MKKTTTLFKFLEKIDIERIMFAICPEHPQTIAVILSCMPPKRAAQIISGLPPERQVGVLRRMVMSKKVELAVIKIVEEELKIKLSNQKFIDLCNIDTVAKVLNDIDQECRHDILENTGLDDPDLVQELNKAIYAAKIISRLAEEGKITVNQ